MAAPRRRKCTRRIPWLFPARAVRIKHLALLSSKPPRRRFNSPASSGCVSRQGSLATPYPIPRSAPARTLTKGRRPRPRKSPASVSGATLWHSPCRTLPIVGGPKATPRRCCRSTCELQRQMLATSINSALDSDFSVADDWVSTGCFYVPQYEFRR